MDNNSLFQPPHHPTLGIIGAGKVGGALARLWAARGYTVTAVYSRREASAVVLAEAVGARVVDKAASVLQYADLTLLTVPDDAIEAAAADLAAEITTASAVIHTSGAHNRHILSALSARGVQTGSLHPAYPFASVEAAVAGLPGATFAVEAEDPMLLDWLHGLVAALNGRAIIVTPDDKARYHAALVIASNYTVTLYSIAERLLTGIGAERDAVAGALNALLSGTVANLQTLGTPAALTGPLVRGDLQTVAAHLRALDALDPALGDLYRALARQTYPLLSGTTDDIEVVLKTS